MNSKQFDKNSERLRTWQTEAESQGVGCVVAGLIFNQEGKTFVQKRAEHRQLFPGCWDLVGGHVDAGETLWDALAREIAEETGWTLRRIVHLVTIFDWHIEEDGDRQTRREFDFLVEVAGDLHHPQIETHKFSEWRWIGWDDLPLLKENRHEDDQVIYHIVKKALEMKKRN